MKIFLVGLPGSGKSTLGKSVARALKIPFVDLDNEIENQEGERIAVLFAKKGEDYFRNIESEMLQAWCAKGNNFLMATGGGTPCFNSNMDLINKSGISVFLDASIEVIVKRMLDTELASRPLLANQNADTILNHVTTLRNQRLFFYQKAKLTFKDEEVTEEKITKGILDLEREANRN